MNAANHLLITTTFQIIKTSKLDTQNVHINRQTKYYSWSFSFVCWCDTETKSFMSNLIDFQRLSSIHGNDMELV